MNDDSTSPAESILRKYKGLANIYQYIDGNWRPDDTARGFLARTDWSESHRAIISNLITEPEVDSELHYHYYLRCSSSTYRKAIFKSVFRLINASVHGFPMTENAVGNLELTRDCNGSCRHCYYDAESRNAHIDNDILNQIMSFLIQYYRSVNLFGGEPLMDNRVLKIAEEYPHMLFYFTTNGKLIDDQFVERAYALGNIFPVISLDGTASAHDKLRGDGSFREAVRAVKIIRNHSLPLLAISTVSHLNVDDLLGDEFLSFVEENGIIILYLPRYYPVGKVPKHDLVLEAEDILKYEERLNIIKNRYPFTIGYDRRDQVCEGLLTFDVEGNIKICPALHFSKVNAESADAKISLEMVVKEMIVQWQDFTLHEFHGCPMFSDPEKLARFFSKHQWRPTSGLQAFAENQEFLAKLSANCRKYIELSKDKRKADCPLNCP